jgi:hypothetical protein
MAYNLATAALATGVNKSTILRAIKACASPQPATTPAGRSRLQSFTVFSRPCRRPQPMSNRRYVILGMTGFFAPRQPDTIYDMGRELTDGRFRLRLGKV